MGFTHHVDLSHTNTLKPHPKAYLLGTDAMGLEPGEVLFVDDQPVNIAGAASAGLLTHHFDVMNVAGSVDAIRLRTGLS